MPNASARDALRLNALTKFGVETNPTRRYQLLARAERILIEDEAVVAPTFHEGFTRLIRPSVEGLVFPPYGVFVDFKYASIRDE